MAQPPTDPLQAGKAAMRAGQLQQAIDLFVQATQQDPQSEAAWSHLGAAHMQKQEMDHAIGAFRRAAQAAPQSARAHYNLGYALQAAGRAEDARRAYQQALQTDPSYAQAQQALASLGPAPQPAQPAPAPVPPAPVSPQASAQTAVPPAPIPPAPVGGQAQPPAAPVPPAPVGRAAAGTPQQAQPPPQATPQGAPPAAAPPAQGAQQGMQQAPPRRPAQAPPRPAPMGPRQPLPSQQPPAHARNIMTTVGAGLSTSTRIGKGVLAGIIAAFGTGLTWGILSGGALLLFSAAFMGEKTPIAAVAGAALINAIVLIVAFLVIGAIVGVLAGAANNPRPASFLPVLCALGWGLINFLVRKPPAAVAIGQTIVPLLAAVLYVWWFGIAFESQFRARADDVLGKDRARHGRRVT